MSNVVLKPFNRDMTEEVVNLWNEHGYGHSIFADIPLEEFKTKFFGNPNYKDE